MAIEEATTDQCIELAQALEQQRALHIVEAVKAIPVGGANSDMPTPFQAGFQLACEEIEHRLRTEQWELCGTLAPLEPKTPNAEVSGAGTASAGLPG